jgi:hypothetical protein
LVAEGSLEEAVGDSGLEGTSVLTAPKAAELGGLYCITQHGELKEVLARGNCSGECRGESQNLSSLFEELFVHDL